jgi:hypothetical protein
MVEPGSHAVDPIDEGRHPPDPEELWSESYYADFVTEDGGLGGYIRLGLYPNLGVTWWTAMIVKPGQPLLAWADYSLPVPGGGELQLQAHGVDVGCFTPKPLEEFTVRARGIAEMHREPQAVYEDGHGQPIELDLDLTWLTDGSPYHYVLTTRYEVPCQVFGRLRIGDQEIAVTGQGQRDHSWGVRDWWSLSWCWSAARLDDGTRIHATDVRFPNRPAFGYVQTGTTLESVSDLIVSERLGPHGLPDSARIKLEPGGLDVEVTPLAFGPLVLTAADGRISHFPRAMARFDVADGRSGTGWIEWNQPPPAQPW